MYCKLLKDLDFLDDKVYTNLPKSLLTYILLFTSLNETNSPSGFLALDSGAIFPTLTASLAMNVVNSFSISIFNVCPLGEF